MLLCLFFIFKAEKNKALMLTDLKEQLHPNLDKLCLSECHEGLNTNIKLMLLLSYHLFSLLTFFTPKSISSP